MASEMDAYRAMTHGADETIVQGLLDEFESIRKRNRWNPAEVYEYARLKVRNAINNGRTDRDMRRNLAAAVDRLEKRIYLIEELMKEGNKKNDQEEMHSGSFGHVFRRLLAENCGSAGRRND